MKTQLDLDRSEHLCVFPRKLFLAAIVSLPLIKCVDCLLILPVNTLRFPHLLVSLLLSKTNNIYLINLIKSAFPLIKNMFTVSHNNILKR